MIHILHLFLCEECAENHLQNTQSVSCYCPCHSSAYDDAHWQEHLPLVMTALRKEREEND